MGDARRVALTALEKCRRAGAWSDAVLGGVMASEKLDARDRALAAALCYGVQQQRMLLDDVLERVSDRKLSQVEPKVWDILRLSAYQILFMDKIPASAAVNEGVRLCRASGFVRASGYVNAVLRKISADPVLPEPGGTAAERLSIHWSHPQWLVEYLISRLGEAEAERFLQCDNAPAPLTLQVNTLKTDAETLQALLERDGIAAEKHPLLPDCLTVAAGDAARTEAFRSGLFYVQDAAAKLAVLTAEPKAGQRILDVCAAPGGKSFAAAILSGGAAKITACDLHENKLKRIREGAERLGVRVDALAADAGENRAEWNGAFDLVIADVPCSGLGVIRKKPDIRYKDPAAFAGLPEVQTRILNNVSRYVRPGGTLLYSTCTIRSEENEEPVRGFLAEHTEFSAESMRQLWPQRDGTDGFFIAKLRRI